MDYFTNIKNRMSLNQRILAKGTPRGGTPLEKKTKTCSDESLRQYPARPGWPTDALRRRIAWRSRRSAQQLRRRSGRHTQRPADASAPEPTRSGTEQEQAAR